MNMTRSDKPQPSRRPVLIMGIGNYVLEDEGFGVHAVMELSKMGVPAGIDLLDGGTAGLHLMGYLQNYDHLIVLDAALDKYPAGTLRCVRPHYEGFPPLVTAHEIGLKDVLEALAVTGFCPDTQLIVASVKKYTQLGTELSPEVEAAVLPACEKALELAMGFLPAEVEESQGCL